MYIKYKENNYPCDCHPSDTMVYKGLHDDFPAPVDGEIVLCADDDFVMRTDNSADYLRQTFDEGVLTLTNEPDPEPVEPVKPVPKVESVKYDELAAAITEGVNEV